MSRYQKMQNCALEEHDGNQKTTNILRVDLKASVGSSGIGRNETALTRVVDFVSLHRHSDKSWPRILRPTDTTMTTTLFFCLYTVGCHGLVVEGVRRRFEKRYVD